jgi:hypothetical protein|tara:strand:- start:323 stop:667 length:345 start_codon:yes stop_codon:yes gene_type:complete
MKGILIDAFNETVKEVVITGNYKEIYALVECRTFDCVDIDEYNTMYVDDEGLLKEPNRYFSIHGRDYAGNGLIIGNNDEGESIDSTLTVEQVKDMISFLPEGYKKEPFFSFHEL